MTKPLTKHERFNIQTCPLSGREKELVDAYEATVAVLKAEVAELQGTLTEAKDNYDVMLDGACHEGTMRRKAEAALKPFPELETCQVCGRAMGIGFHVADEVWRQLSPSGDEWGVLCPLVRR